MAKQRKKRKANPNVRRKSVQSGPPVRLSQCMIVKNEEKNIERALSWAKDFAYEQIVVDTGSTDRTVEIAERMGAKVYHFKWINDFSAAKNYAIEQATGNWIAFLDADEYLTERDAHRLWAVLNHVERDEMMRAGCMSIQSPWVQLDDNNEIFCVYTQVRVFRNIPSLRYVGAIHEALTHETAPYSAPDINIMHTGYTSAAFAETDKGSRNVELLLKEMERNPDDINLKGYLADSLRIKGEHTDIERAKALYTEVIACKTGVIPMLKQSAYNYLILEGLLDDAKIDGNIELSRQAVEDFPDNPDYRLYLGMLLRKKEKYKDAWEHLTECEKLLRRDFLELASFSLLHPKELFIQLLLTAEELGKHDEVIRCTTHLLKDDKYSQDILTPYIYELKAHDGKVSDDDIVNILSSLYDLSSTKDKLFVIRAAKDAGNITLFEKLYALLTPEELEWLSVPASVGGE